MNPEAMTVKMALAKSFGERPSIAFLRTTGIETDQQDR